MMRVGPARALDQQLAAVASQMARDVRAGATLEGALRHAVPDDGGRLAADLGRVVEVHVRGVGLDRALEAWRAARRSPAVDLFVVACRFAQVHGGRTSVALDGAAAALAARAEVAEETDALTAQARLSVSVLAGLPVAGAAVFSLLDPTVGRTLLATPAGWCCLGVGALLDGLGVVLARRLVARTVDR